MDLAWENVHIVDIQAALDDTASFSFCGNREGADMAT